MVSDLWQINVGYACAGIEVAPNGICIGGAPIFRWMVGKSMNEIYKWVEKKRGTMRKVETA